MIDIRAGFSDGDRRRVAALFWDAFGSKLALPLGPRDQATDFLSEHLNPAFALSAYRNDRLLGVAGFKTGNGGLVGGGLTDLARVYGWPSALWRGAVLGLLERDLKDHQLLMDGIFVADDARGQGVGSALLEAILHHARSSAKSEVRLDVIAQNPRAHALYLRHGFVDVQTQSHWIAKRLFGIGAVTEMVCRL